jgi:hypothetical protein
MGKNCFSFKKLFWSYIFFGTPLAIVGGLLALFHVTPIYFNETPTYGFKGLIIAILFVPFLGLLLGGANWVALNFGYFLYNAFLKSIKKDKREFKS